MPPKRTLNHHDATQTAFLMETKNAPARGRQRFLFDLQNAAQCAVQGVEVNGLRLLDVIPGDEDGSFDCVVSSAVDDLHVVLTVLVSDASEYPSDHSFFGSSQHELPPEVAAVLDTLYEHGSLTIQDLLMRLLRQISRTLSMAQRRQRTVDENESDDDEEEEEEADGIEDYDMDDAELFGVDTGSQAFDGAQLQREFIETVAYGYQPGFIRFGIDDFALSVSIPVKSLPDTIPARALIAWDKRLLSGSQHLTLLLSGMKGVHPVVEPAGTLTRAAVARSATPHFRVGLTPEYKPARDDAAELLRRFGMKDDHGAEFEELVPIEEDRWGLSDSEESGSLPSREPNIDDEQPRAKPTATHGFLPFSLSSSLESLLNGHFLSLLQLRIKYHLGWSGAEFLRWEIETTQREATDILNDKAEEILRMDENDKELAESYRLPTDCLIEREEQNTVNLPLVAFSYLMRRLTLCPRYCLVCHQQLKEDLDALKPYVCSSSLCTYQYYNLNRGPSLEYEICSKPAVVDLLVSLAFVAAIEGALNAPLPIGMGLRVRCRGSEIDSPDGLHDFDRLDLPNMRAAIHNLIDQLPPIAEIKRYLEQPRKPGRAKPRLQDMDRTIPEAAWLVLRWCVASCTAHLEELVSEDEKVKNMDPLWKQFRFSVGAPDAEAKFRKAVREAQDEYTRAREFPSLYAFHGSNTCNWHSIIRHGLWFKTIAHGRAYGHGVYFAKDGVISMGTYSARTRYCWRNSAIKLSACVALAEIVNLPGRFRSTNPFFVVDKTEWIVCRYLMVKGPMPPANPAPVPVPPPALSSLGQHLLPPVGVTHTHPEGVNEQEEIQYVALDPNYPLTLSQTLIRIPQPEFALQKLLKACREEYTPISYDADDLLIFSGEEGNAGIVGEASGYAAADDWEHNREWVEQCVENLMPPPAESSPMASTSLQKELRAMIKEQKSAKSMRELGWYLPEEMMGDNLYQWIVELHSFDSALPVAQDLERNAINSLVFEIRFPPTFPHSPPFFRILKPRFLPFVQGGGGHVTGGGSMCMDLLTADGWLPSYSISAILLQIKLAISNLDPRPARLASNWNSPYGMYEALEGYKRAASHHGWKIPQELDKLTR
ncbi:hypothetical protein BC628DRAFT_1379076 [Trametes gibbosa]|nr:hypothetical protein BC628DRAFT_1379076 [Trametes gibbosa]